MLRIRRAQSDDIFPVIALAFDTLPERYNPSIFTQFYETSPEGFLVAFHDRAIIGFLIGLRTTPTTARILMLSVKESYRKQGVGTALLTQFLKEMKRQNITQVDLEVRMTNQNALTFYTKQGFSVQGLLPQFYQNGEHAYSMKKEL